MEVVVERWRCWSRCGRQYECSRTKYSIDGNTVANALDGWHGNSQEEKQCVERLKMYVLFVEQNKFLNVGFYKTSW